MGGRWWSGEWIWESALPGSYGGKAAVIEGNLLSRQVDEWEEKWICQMDLRRWMGISGTSEDSGDSNVIYG